MAAPKGIGAEATQNWAEPTEAGALAAGVGERGVCAGSGWKGAQSASASRGRAADPSVAAKQRAARAGRALSESEERAMACFQGGWGKLYYTPIGEAREGLPRKSSLQGWRLPGLLETPV